MAAFSTLALAGLGLAGVFGLGKALTKDDPMKSKGPAPGPLGRSRPADSPILGQAIKRPDPTNLGGTPTPPDATKLAADAGNAADIAAQKAKKRGASGSLLTDGPGGNGAPAKLAPRTLIGY